MDGIEKHEDHDAASSLSHGRPPASSWEYVMSFRAPDEHTTSAADLTVELRKASRSRTSVLRRLRAAGFAYEQIWAPAEEAILVKIALPDDKLRAYAELTGLELQLLPRYGGGYLKYSEDRAECFANSRNEKRGRAFFSPSDRLRIVLHALSSKSDGGAAIDLKALTQSGVLLQSYAKHCEPDRGLLVEKTVFRRWWDPLYSGPLSKLRKYTGGRVALYFAFLAFYTRMLVGIALLSIPVNYILTSSTSWTVIALTRFLFGMSLVFWATYFPKYWRRRTAILNVKWGLSDFVEDTYNDVRPEYEGIPRAGFYCKGGFVPLDDLDPTSPAIKEKAASEESISSPNDGDETDESESGGLLSFVKRQDIDFKLETRATGVTFEDLPAAPYCSKKLLRNRLLCSGALTVLFAALMSLATFTLLYFRTAIINYFGRDGFGPKVPGIANGLLIFVSDNLWKKMSSILTKWENPRNQQSYIDSNVRKRFAFQFVSNYVSLFYIAFVKPYTPSDACELSPIDGKPNCMHELGTQLGALVITKATIQQLMELGIPFATMLSKFVKQWFDAWKMKYTLSEEQRQRLVDIGASVRRLDADVAESKLGAYRTTTEDYGELIIQYGYVALFGLAYPPAALVALVNNIIERRTDAFKILVLNQRVTGEDAAGIGKWQDLIGLISNIAILTNASLIVFTGNAVNRVFHKTDFELLLVFFIFEHILFFIKNSIELSVSGKMSFFASGIPIDTEILIKGFNILQSVPFFLSTDVPGRTYRQVARQRYLISRWFGVGEKDYYQPKSEELDISGDEDDNQFTISDLRAILSRQPTYESV